MFNQNTNIMKIEIPSKLEKTIIENYHNVSFSELCKLTNVKFTLLRGLISSMAKSGTLKTKSALRKEGKVLKPQVEKKKKSNNDNYIPLSTNIALRDKIIIEFNSNNSTYKDLIENFGVSFSTLVRLKKYAKNNGLLTNDKEVKNVTNKDDGFSNDNGIKKEHARNKIVEAIRVSGLYGKILTLPYIYCRIERKLIKEVSKKFSFVGCEKKLPIYHKMLNTVAQYGLNMECSPNPLIEKIEKANENEFSHGAFDFCGQLNTTHKEIRAAIERKIVQVNGTISITLNDRGWGDIEEEMNALNPLGDIEGKKVQNAIVTFLRIVGGFDYVIETVYKYTDKGENGSRAHMILVIIRRVK